MLADNLRFLRTKAGYSQPKIASLINIPFKRYQSYEGRIKPPIDTLLSLSKLFAVDVYELIYDDLSTAKSKVSEADKMFARYQQQAPNVKKAIDHLLNQN